MKKPADWCLAAIAQICADQAVLKFGIDENDEAIVRGEFDLVAPALL